MNLAELAVAIDLRGLPTFRFSRYLLRWFFSALWWRASWLCNISLFFVYQECMDIYPERWVHRLRQPQHTQPPETGAVEQSRCHRGRASLTFHKSVEYVLIEPRRFRPKYKSEILDSRTVNYWKEQGLCICVCLNDLLLYIISGGEANNLLLGRVRDRTRNGLIHVGDEVI